MTTEVKKFTIYWRHGEKSVVTGISIERAFSDAGYGRGAVAAVDWYDNGETDTHNWDSGLKQWVRKEPIIDFSKAAS